MQRLITAVGSGTQTVEDLTEAEVTRRTAKAEAARLRIAAKQQATANEATAQALAVAARPARVVVAKILAGESLTAAELQGVVRFLALQFLRSRDA